MISSLLIFATLAGPPGQSADAPPLASRTGTQSAAVVEPSEAFRTFVARLHFIGVTKDRIVVRGDPASRLYRVGDVVDTDLGITLRSASGDTQLYRVEFQDRTGALVVRTSRKQ
jgi:hypothetical protein